MKSSVFHFKQFEIKQDRTAMKVGTDGVLLGAWAKIGNARNILDVGTGTGVIALMLAQRNPLARIDALELEPEAVQQAYDNFQTSPWKERLSVIQADFNRFQSSIRYDLILSNPPYFDENYLSKNVSRNLARHTHSLRLDDLLIKSKKLLSKQGSIQLILPIQKEEELCHILRGNSLYINRLTRVKGRVDLPVIRILVDISVEKLETIQNTLIIEKARHVYTDEYISLTKDYYLKM